MCLICNILDDDNELYNIHVLKYGCGRIGALLDPETACEPLFKSDGSVIDGERCFCKGDSCVDPEDDGKYLDAVLETRMPMFVDVRNFTAGNLSP